MATNYPIAGGDIKDAQIYLSIHQENGNQDARVAGDSVDIANTRATKPEMEI